MKTKQSLQNLQIDTLRTLIPSWFHLFFSFVRKQQSVWLTLFFLPSYFSHLLLLQTKSEWWRWVWFQLQNEMQNEDCQRGVFVRVKCLYTLRRQKKILVVPFTGVKQRPGWLLEEEDWWVIEDVISTKFEMRNWKLITETCCGFVCFMFVVIAIVYLIY